MSKSPPLKPTPHIQPQQPQKFALSVLVGNDLNSRRSFNSTETPPSSRSAAGEHPHIGGSRGAFSAGYSAVGGIVGQPNAPPRSLSGGEGAFHSTHTHYYHHHPQQQQLLHQEPHYYHHYNQQQYPQYYCSHPPPNTTGSGATSIRNSAPVNSSMRDPSRRGVLGQQPPPRSSVPPAVGRHHFSQANQPDVPPPHIIYHHHHQQQAQRRPPPSTVTSHNVPPPQSSSSSKTKKKPAKSAPSTKKTPASVAAPSNTPSSRKEPSFKFLRREPVHSALSQGQQVLTSSNGTRLVIVNALPKGPPSQHAEEGNFLPLIPTSSNARDEWLILDSNLETRFSTDEKWRHLLHTLQISFFEPYGHRDAKQFLIQLKSDWRQITATYWLASYRVRERFRYRIAPEPIPDHDSLLNEEFDLKHSSSDPRRQFFIAYRNAQLKLLTKAEKHLREILLSLLQPFREKVINHSRAHATISAPQNSHTTGGDENSTRSRSGDTPLPLVRYLQNFMVDHLTCPYMDEQKMQEVAHQFLVDRRRVKRRLQNMRTRIWKPFVVEFDLVSEKQFRSGNQLKKQLSAKVSDLEEWQKQFKKYLTTKRCPHWNYDVSDYSVVEEMDQSE